MQRIASFPLFQSLGQGKKLEFCHISGPDFSDSFGLIHLSKILTEVTPMACFKERKIPKHLIIQEEFQYQQKSRISLIKVLMYTLLLFGLSYSVLLITP